MYTYLKPTKILYYGFEKTTKVSTLIKPFSGYKFYNQNLRNIEKESNIIIRKMEQGKLTPVKFKSVYNDYMLSARQNIEMLNLSENSGEIDEHTRIIYEDRLSRACNKPLEYCDRRNVSGNNEMHNTITERLEESFYYFRRLVAYKKAKLNTQIHDFSCEKHDMSLRVGNTRHDHLACESENYDNEMRAKHAGVTYDGKYLIKSSKDGVWYRESYLNHKTGRTDFVSYIFNEIDKNCPDWIRMNSRHEKEVFIPNVDVTPGLKYGKSFISPYVFNTTVDKNDAFNLKAAPALGTICDNYANGNIEKDLVIGIANGDLPKDYKLLDIIKLFHEVMNESK